jgi:hypothetical protein
MGGGAHTRETESDGGLDTAERENKNKEHTDEGSIEESVGQNCQDSRLL